MSVAAVLLLVRTAAAAETPFSGSSVAVRGRDFVVIAADATHRRGDLTFSNVERRGVEAVGPRCVAAFVGHPADAAAFAEFVKQNLLAYAFLAGAHPSGRAAAHWVRRELADQRRRRRGSMPRLRVMLGSLDAENAAALHWMDETGAMVELPYGAHGAGAPLVLGHLDATYDPDITVDAAVALVGDCLDRLRKGSAQSVDAAVIAVLDASGCAKRNWDPPKGA